MRHRPTTLRTPGPLVALCDECGKAVSVADAHPDEECQAYWAAPPAEDGWREVEP